MALAASVSPWRAGGTSPAAAPQLAGAPGLAPEARAISGSRLRRSLRASTAEGLFAEIVGACAGGAVLTGWAIHLHASTLLTGVVVALPQMAQLLQLPAAWSTARLGHRRAAVSLICASRLVTLPLAVLPLLHLSVDAGRALLLVVATVAAALGVLGNNAWVSWMGDLVPRRVRGRYFGRRTALCTLGGAAASGVAGLLLDWARPRGQTGAVLAALQVAAAVAGLVTTALLMRQHEPVPHLRAAPPPFVRSGLRPFRDPSVRGLLRYLLTWNLAVGLAGSFFSLHMLKNLHMGFTLVALHGTALAGARVLAAPLWGRAIDRLGARPVMITCSFGISFIPVIWLFVAPGFLWPLALDAIMAGTLWCGHSLATFALPLSVTPRLGRSYYVAAFAVTSGVAFSVATAAGGAVAGLLPSGVTVAGHAFFNLQVVFAASALLRFAAAFTSLRIHEPAAAGVSALFAEVMSRPAPAGATPLGAVYPGQAASRRS